LWAQGVKEQNDKLQALIADNDVSVRNYELENAVREITKERKKVKTFIKEFFFLIKFP